MPSVLLIGTLDTKGGEYAFVRDRLHQSGVDTLVLDAGVLGSFSGWPISTTTRSPVRGAAPWPRCARHTTAGTRSPRWRAARP
ncbi:MAG: hypothetical protein QOE54_2807 [Streptosporangiaceae bacterium]|jgi:uncharacterized protein (UPF0261 family)|nr:hypothetical protein [Streptosporangiaceae bacterium]MDX6430441.1 hypothetical protein [Streptosporangiaceae bacterium]